MRETLPLTVPTIFTALLWLRLSLTAQVRYVVSFGWGTSPGDGCVCVNVTLTVALSYGPRNSATVTRGIHAAFCSRLLRDHRPSGLLLASASVIYQWQKGKGLN